MVGAEPELTLHEAADRLGVHYMTAYGYVRTGRLPARREGVQWRIRAPDVDRLLHPPVTRPARSRASVRSESLAARMVAGDERGAWSMIERALVSGCEPVDVHLELLVPAMRWIGEEWELGRLDIADEHCATAIAQRLVARLGPRFARPGRTKGTIVLGCVAGERHALASAFLADLLRGQGFTVVDLGADTPAACFAIATRAASRPRAVLVGASREERAGDVAATVEALREADLQVPVFVGGAGVVDASAATSLGADGWSGLDGPAACAAVQAIVGGHR